MAGPSEDHHSNEFGRPPSTGVKGLDAPMIGAATGITLDGIVERESGVTPPPPPISLKAFVIAFIVMFLVGAGMLTALHFFS
ncbi:MAG TPA: hypothetical protein VIK31_08005 [Propionibacteriaceae bacterium]